MISCALAIAALALGAADAKAPALFRPLAFQHRAVPDKVRLGDPLVYELQITHPADQRYELRPPRDLADLELTGTERGRADDQGKAVTTFKLHMAAFALGKQKLPDLVFDVISGDGSSGTFETHGAEVEVVPTISPTAAQNGEPLYDIQPPTEVPVRTWRLLWALAALLAAAALGYAASRFLRRATAAKPEKALPLEPLDVRALRALDELRAEDLPGRGLFREFHFRLSEIVRGYLGERFGFDALECTSVELLDQLRRLRTPGLDYGSLERHVHESDLVKFARSPSTIDACKREMEWAYRVVQTTTAAMAPPAPPIPSARPPGAKPPSDAVRPLP
ncbi:MAG TPA: hypothetical protein VFA20_05410 [Myxococcaceae bacterium]|nr:hypothetical protein [Myxococcaceae bacterium]